MSEARRDKFLMNKCVSEHDLRTVQQKLCTSLEESLAFATELGLTNEREPYNINAQNQGVDTFKQSIRASIGSLGRASNIPPQMSSQGKYCVVKPARGVASDSVSLCSTLEEVKSAFNQIQGSAIFGSPGGEKHKSVVSIFIFFSSEC